MAKKIIIENGNAIVVIDTDSGKRLLSEPIKSIWYNEEMLQKGVVQFTNIDPEDTQHLLSVSLSDCLDSTDSLFTEESFRTFAQSNLGFNSAGRSSALKTAAYLIGWQDFADTTTQSTPIAQTLVNGGEVQLTNNNGDTLTDGNTSVNAETTAKGVNDLWSTQSNTFVFGNTGLDKNDLLSLRIDLKISANIISQDFSLRFDFYDQIDGLGTKQFSLTQQASTETLGAGVFRERILTVDAFVGESILNGSAKLFLVGTKSFEVEVVGWNIRIFKIAR